MATKAHLSIDEYLDAKFDRDPEYVDGELVYRGMGSNDHSGVQGRLSGFFWSRRGPVKFIGRPELHLRVAPNVFRIPDYCLYLGVAPADPYPSVPPHVVVEIQSPGDTLDDLRRKLPGYAALGVPNIWVIEPATRQLFIYRNGALTEVGEFQLPDLAVTLTKQILFED